MKRLKKFLTSDEVKVGLLLLLLPAFIVVMMALIMLPSSEAKNASFKKITLNYCQDTFAELPHVQKVVFDLGGYSEGIQNGTLGMRSPKEKDGVYYFEYVERGTEVLVAKVCSHYPEP